MPKYLVQVRYEYPVDAVNAEDALATVPIAARMKYLNADGTTEIINSEGKMVLKAKRCLKNEQNKNKGVDMGKSVEIEILGHKAEILWIHGFLANPPLRKEDRLSVWIALAEPVDGLSGFAMNIPIENYGKNELLEKIKTTAEKILLEAQERSRWEREARENKDRRERELNELGNRLLEMLST